MVVRDAIFAAGSIKVEMISNHITSFHGVYRHLHGPAVVIGGTFSLIALILSVLLILRHLRSYTNPAEQKWIVGVLFMVPLYASESVISLSNPKFSLVCDILRNCYEAFALYSFGSYLVACLGGEERVVDLLERESKKPQTEKLLKRDEEEVHHGSFHDFFCEPSALGKDLYSIVKFGLVQYMILKTLCSFLALLLEPFGLYGDGEFKWYYGYPYIAAVLNFSQMWALYCLVQFYNLTHDRLQPIRPLAKFISFKAIVFATWWQGVGIAIICYFGILPKEEKIQNGIQDFLICIEMAVAAVAHVYIFSPEPYRCLPASEHGKTTTFETKTNVKMEDLEEGPAVVEETETRVKAPGTSFKESVQDVVLGGGEHVVKDVALTISQAMEPVEKGVTRIQESLHISSGSGEEGAKVEVDEHIKKDVKKGAKVEVEVGKHVTEEIKEGDVHVVTAEKEVVAEPAD